jgi:hypothetical protein
MATNLRELLLVLPLYHGLRSELILGIEAAPDNYIRPVTSLIPTYDLSLHWIDLNGNRVSRQYPQLLISSHY